MKTNKLMLIALALIMATGYWSCRKEDKKNSTLPNDYRGTLWDNSKMVKSSISGIITDEDDHPLENVSVITGTHSTRTDEDGYFFFSDISTPKNATLITAEQNGYFKGLRTIVVKENQDHQVRIKMLSKSTPLSVDAEMGGTVSVTNGGTIEFEAGSFVVESTGQPYSGRVLIYAKHINPEASDFAERIPGALRAVNEEGYERTLISFGMMAVELEGGSGEKLQIAEGNAAEVKFPLSSTQLNDAPQSIDLWSLDESTGIWSHEGVATLEGNHYAAKVSHFSFWNCDIPVQCTYGTFTFVNSSGTPFPNLSVELKVTSSSANIPNSQTTRYGYTNSNGVVTGIIPSNCTMDLSYSFPGCGNYIFAQSVTVGTSPINIGPIVVNSTTLTSVSGSVIDCNGNTIPNAPIKIVIGSNNALTGVANASGTFHINTGCMPVNTAMDATVYNPVTLENGTSTHTVQSNTNNALGALSACGAQSQYLNWTVTNPAGTGTPVTYSITEPNGNFYYNFQNNITSISGLQSSGQSWEMLQFAFTGPDNTTGPHNITFFSDHIDSFSTIGTSTINITEYGPSGTGRVKGTFNMQNVVGLVYNNAQVTGDFIVNRP